jgi:hypothetical protein
MFVHAQSQYLDSQRHISWSSFFFVQLFEVKGEYSSCLMILVELLTVIAKTLILQTTIYYVGTFHMIFSCGWMCWLITCKRLEESVILFCNVSPTTYPKTLFLCMSYYKGFFCCVQEELKDTKGVIRIHKSKKYRQHNGQKKKDKQRSTKHYSES